MIELLETRRLLAFTVTQGSPGFYEVTCDAADDVVTISVDQGGHSISVNGVIYGNASFVTIYGNGGNDQISVSATGAGSIGVSIQGADGDDVIDAQAATVPVVLYGEGGRDRLYGSPFDDILDGGTGRDYLFGRDGDDMFYTRDGDLDYVIGGNGTDTCQCDAAEMNISGVEVVLMP